MTMGVARQIIEDVAALQSVAVEDILSPSRVRSVADARAIVCYILLRHFKMSSTDVGRAVNRNHASVLIAANKVEEWLKMPKQYFMAVTTIMSIERFYNLKRSEIKSE